MRDDTLRTFTPAPAYTVCHTAYDHVIYNDIRHNRSARLHVWLGAETELFQLSTADVTTAAHTHTPSSTLMMQRCQVHHSFAVSRTSLYGLCLTFPEEVLLLNFTVKTNGGVLTCDSGIYQLEGGAMLDSADFFVRRLACSVSNLDDSTLRYTDY